MIDTILFHMTLSINASFSKLFTLLIKLFFQFLQKSTNWLKWLKISFREGSESYKDLLGVSYSGTLWDYLDVYTELDMDWVPHFLIWRESEAKKGTRSYMDWLKEQGLEPKKRRGLENTGESCACPVPPVNCRTGGKQVSCQYVVVSIICSFSLPDPQWIRLKIDGPPCHISQFLNH